MTCQFRRCDFLVVALLVCSASWSYGQVGGQGGITAGGSLGRGTQGSRLGSSSSGAGSAAAQGGSTLSLSSRFQSNSNRFTQGSQAMGQTTAGMTAAQGVFGGGMQGPNSLTNQLFSLGALGAFGGARGRNLFGMGMQTQQTNQQTSRQIRTHMVVAVPSPLRDSRDLSAAQTVRSRVMSRMDRTLRRALGERASEVRVRLEGSTAVLQGAVASDHQKQLAELLVKLEPGIADVRNELTVDPRGSTP